MRRVVNARSSAPTDQTYGTRAAVVRVLKAVLLQKIHKVALARRVAAHQRGSPNSRGLIRWRG